MTRITSFLIHLPLTFFSRKEPGCLVPHDATTYTAQKAQASEEMILLRYPASPRTSDSNLFISSASEYTVRSPQLIWWR